MPSEDGPTGLRMSLWAHVEELRKCFLRIIAVVLGIAAFTMIFDVRTAQIGGLGVPYPYPDIYSTISTRLFLRLSHDLLPPTVTLVALAPWDAFMVQLQIALVLGVSLGMPFAVYELGKFLGPALKSREKNLILKLALPSSVLFLLGAVFAYVFIVPFSVEFLYNFASAMGVQQLFTIERFTSFTLMMTFAFGIVAEIPVFIVGLSSLGIVSGTFWLKHWRWALMGSLLFAAMITPDGTGITMSAIALPMMTLYFTGCVIAMSDTKLLTVGLIISVIGAIAASASFLHDSLRVRIGGSAFDEYGIFNWAIVGVGVTLYAVGISLSTFALAQEIRKREQTRGSRKEEVAPQD